MWQCWPCWQGLVQDKTRVTPVCMSGFWLHGLGWTDCFSVAQSRWGKMFGLCLFSTSRMTAK